MIENKLLHYETRAAFELDKPNIANTSIAFIDEGRTIYTWGKEYNSSQVLEQINDVTSEVEQIEREWQEALDEKVAQLTELVTLKHTDAVSRARADIQNAQNTIAEVRQTLASLLESCSTKTELEAVDGKITAVTNWYNLQEQSLTELSQQLDAIEGRIVTEGTYTDIVNNAITNYNREVDLKIALAKEEMSYANTDEMTETVVGRLIDAENGILKDYATIVYLGQLIEGLAKTADISSIVEQTLNAKDPSWNTLVSRVATVEGTTLTLSTLYTNLSATVNGFSAITTQIQDHETRIAQIESNVDDDESKVTLAAVYKVVNEDVNKTIAAKIFALANAQGSNITLSADKINLSGDTTVLGNFIANKISAADITAKALNITNTSTGNSITANATNGLKFTDGTTGRNTFTLAMNGSGSIGYRTVTEEVNGETVTTYEPAISWDLNGNVLINSALIGGGGSELTGPTYVQNPYNDQWIHDWQATINSWKNTITTWKNELEANNTARAYLQPAGIVFDNSALGNIVAMTSTSTNNGTVPAGVSHTAVGGNFNGQHGYYLKNDGTGELAFGNIKWDTEGNLTVKNLTVEGTSFASEEGVKRFNIISILCLYGKTIIRYTITASGVTLKEDVIELDDNPANSGVSRSAIDTVYKPNTTFSYLTYRADKDLIGEWGTVYDAGFITPIYRWDLYFTKLTHTIDPEYSPSSLDWSELEPYVERDLSNNYVTYEWEGPKKLRYVNAMSILTFLAVRSFEYPVFDLNYNIIDHTNKMPDGGNFANLTWVSGPNGTADGYYSGIGDDIDDSRDPNDNYWRDIRNVSNGTYTGIKIDKRYRLFQDVMWKEIFSIPDSNGGRKWLIEDNEPIEVMCTGLYIWGQWLTDSQTSSSRDPEAYYWGNFIGAPSAVYNGGTELLNSPYATSALRDAGIQTIRDIGYEHTNTSSGKYIDGGEFGIRYIPYKGTSHIKFKLNPYEFYENAPDPLFTLNSTYENLPSTRWDQKAYDAWSLSVDESRFGWETW